jgi:putative flippase GtrA
LGFSLLLLMLLVEVVGVPKVPAQALAVSASMPLNFLGNKLWSFRAGENALAAATHEPASEERPVPTGRP